MTNTIRKSDLYEIVSRHSDFDFDTFVANTPVEEYDVWNNYCLPMFYSDPVREYQALRSNCALFDASPMRKFRIKGPDAGIFLDRMLTAPVSQSPSMRASYGLICNPAGFLVDDGILLKYSEQDYLFLITSKDTHLYFSDLVNAEDVIVTDETPDWSGLALQGPKSCAVLQCFGFEGVELLAPFELKTYQLDGYPITLGRLGFTGDLGYEIWFPPEAKGAVLAAIVKAEQALHIDLPGYGLVTVQICRIQAGLIVPGWDTADAFENDADERTPFELTLGWNVKLGREENFIGKAALIQHKSNGPRFKMKGLTVDRNAELEELQPVFAIVRGHEIQVGRIMSLIWHQSDQQFIGYVSLLAEHDGVAEIYVKDNETGGLVNGKLVRPTFVDIQHRNQVPAPC